MNHLEKVNKTPTISIAATDDEKKGIYQFRYHIYVEEMSRQLKSAHENDELLYDEMDEWGIQLCAKVGSELVGISRINIGPLEKFTPYIVDSLALDRFQKFYMGSKDQGFALITKLMVAPHYRNSPVLYLLMAKAYELSCDHRVQFTYGGCNFYLLPLYEQIGGHRYGRNFKDPGYGLLTPIVWLIDDVQHMRKVRSPFFRMAKKRKDLNSQVTDWFFSEFPEASGEINSQLVTEENLWTVLCGLLGNQPHNAIPVLHGLSGAEAKKLIHECGVVAQCYAGDHITTSGDPSNELNILLSGKLQLSGPSAYGTAHILPGQHFGEAGLVDYPNHTQDVISAGQAKILVLSRLLFAKFHHHYPDIAHKLLGNISVLAVESRRRA